MPGLNRGRASDGLEDKPHAKLELAWRVHRVGDLAEIKSGETCFGYARDVRVPVLRRVAEIISRNVETQTSRLSQ